MVDILAAVLTDEVPRAAMDAVEAACAEALAEGVHSADVILRMASLNILARRRGPPPPLTTCGAPPAQCCPHRGNRLAIARACVRNGARGRFFNVVDLVNKLDAEARADRQGRTADLLCRLDFVILDELGYLPFAQTGGQFLFHLIWRPAGAASTNELP